MAQLLALLKQPDHFNQAQNTDNSVQTGQSRQPQQLRLRHIISTRVLLEQR